MAKLQFYDVHPGIAKARRDFDRQFRVLDDLEWYPHFYQRIEIPTNFGDAWMYIVKLELCHGKRQLPGIWR